MKKRKPTRRKARGSRRTRTPKSSGPISVVFSPDGSPIDACACPVCVDNARRGIPTMVMGPDGELREQLPLDLPAMIEALVRGSASTWPELPAEPRTVEVPVGCVVSDLLEYVRGGSRPLQIGFPPGGLWATIDGVPCEDARVVCAGDELRVFGERDPSWSLLAADVIAPTG